MLTAPALTCHATQLTLLLSHAQLSLQQVGTVPGPVLPANVTGELDLTQSLTGPLDNGTPQTRGYTAVPNYNMPYVSSSSQVTLPMALAPAAAPPSGGAAAGGRRLAF